MPAQEPPHPSPPPAHGRVTAPQRDVAAKGSFSVVAAADPAVAKALSPAATRAVLAQATKSGAVCGTVASVFCPAGNGVVLLDLAKDYQKAITAAVLPPFYGRFPDLATLKGRRVLITGTIVNYHGHPEIQPHLRGDIRIVQ